MNIKELLKNKRAKKESQVYEETVQLKFKAADGKNYATDCSETQNLLRLIQSISSPKEEGIRHSKPDTCSHAYHVPFQIFFHFFVFKNGGYYFLQAHEGGFRFHDIIECSVVHTIDGNIYFVLR